MLYRKFSKVLEEWYQDPNKKAILVDGCRQVGKTTLIREFGKKHYGKNFIEINFHTHPEAKGIFKGDLSADSIIDAMGMYLHKDLKPKGLLIFFDEVQECPIIRTAIKFLVDDGRYDYIESGSLLGVMDPNEIASYATGYEVEERMYPMDFEEFAIADGIPSETLEYLKQCYDNLTPVNDFVHDRMIKEFIDYMCVGGMPSAVQKYVDTRVKRKAYNEQKAIQQKWRGDIIKYTNTDADKILSIFEAIPSELRERNRRFVLTDIKKSARMGRYESGINWLVDSGVALPCYNATEPKPGLSYNCLRNLFKFFLADTGVLISMDKNKTLQYEVSTGNLEVNQGGILENMIAQQLASNGFEELYYYNVKGLGEIDFLVEDKAEVIPIEVKSGEDYTDHKSLSKLLKLKEYSIKRGVVFCRGNISRNKDDDRIIYIPLYMIMFFKRDESYGETPSENIGDSLAKFFQEMKSRYLQE
ncbi:MAG: ATP-binding protein [Clostridia bacterium]|nr:ATP-binding protein [Clostridia bacterium]